MIIILQPPIGVDCYICWNRNKIKSIYTFFFYELEIGSNFSCNIKFLKSASTLQRVFSTCLICE